MRPRLRSLTVNLLIGFACIEIAAAQSGNGNSLSDGVVKIAVLSDMSSIYKDIEGSGAVAAARMAIDDFGGTILGKPIELVSADHQSKSDVASTLARQFVDQQKVDVFIGTGSSGTALATQEVASSNKKISIALAGGTTALTEEQCTKYGIQYVYNVGALSVGTANALIARGNKTWFFLIADYAFGHSLLKNGTNVITSLGGKVVDSVAAPLGTHDFGSFLIQAKSSKAQVIALGNAGSDLINSVKQARTFGIKQPQQQLVAMIMFLGDAKALGVEAAQGMQYTTGFYWDRTKKSRQWSQRFFKKVGAMPTMAQAGAYSAVTQYLKAVEEAGTDNSDKVRDVLGKAVINDMFTDSGKILPNGSMVHDMYLMEIKSPSESKGPWDLAKVVGAIPAEKAFLPLAKSSCALTK